ncbi:E3 ubiquitin-protein ligase SDIR1-like [Solanum pennellii]|uniref:RING-type E3 ubiquitin transferase n=1 Tax=Solanum pennellii TaxID=28526 RepID=A0ABM1GYZ5_SOLPN|nr:E3 ubiquitin-protein ligase SDIR1-like [Solanum pennellii]XP_015077935.1 E3 ubiquitin-protein ligase SDIR1-like [Solanum pennellii]XP_027773344.1 E3 ubiquitin-protein ligase SDIR1-like [Solanum pennellii]XP_027773345.1 E3 ubiquitin-protein ligase SDIR1-like [Solanum pennellii]
MSIVRKFFSSATVLSSVILTILAVVIYAISPPDDSWVLVGVIAIHVVPVIVVVMIYEICSIRQARDRERIAPVNHLIDSDELHYDVPPLESFPTRRRLQDLRLQIANLNREVDEFEHHTYGELSSIFRIPSVNDEEIDACLESEDAPPEQASSSSTSALASDQESMTIGVPDEDGSSDELICNICLEPVIEGDLVCCFPCIHQFHAVCLDKWLELSPTCPVCNLC